MPVTLVQETTNGSDMIYATYVSKDPYMYTRTKKKKVFLNSILILILLLSLDIVMYNNICELHIG